MKKSILSLATLLIMSCSSNTNEQKKADGPKTCYECDSDGKGNYQGVGCMTDEEWNNFKPIDLRSNNLGNYLDKSKYCRKQVLPK